MLAAYLLDAELPIPVAFAGALASSGSSSASSTAPIISRFRINPLIATLATLAIVRGLAFVICGGKEIVIDDPTWLGLGTDDLLGIPYIVILLLGTFLVFGWVMPRTPFGRYAYAIGSNARAVAAGGCGRRPLAAGLLRDLRVLGGAVRARAHGAHGRCAAAEREAGIELDVITAVILGGTALTGGRGTLAGTLVACCSSASSTTASRSPAYRPSGSYRQGHASSSPQSSTTSAGATIGTRRDRPDRGHRQGWWATRAHLPALAADPEATVVACASPSEATAAGRPPASASRTRYADARDMLAAETLDAADHRDAPRHARAARPRSASRPASTCCSRSP